MMIYDTDLMLGDKITDIIGCKYLVEKIDADRIVYRIESDIRDAGNLVATSKRHKKLGWASKVIRNGIIIYSDVLEIDNISEGRPF